MRFDKDTRAKIQSAAPNSAFIRWPVGEREPQKGRVYWMQALEDIEKAERRIEEHPETCKDVMAQMHRRHHGEWPEGYEPPKPRRKRPRSEDTPCILVLDVDVLERGWEATVVLYEDPDPIRHTGVKARVHKEGGPLATVQGDHTETEPEQIVKRQSRAEREEAADALKAEHKASIDRAELPLMEKRIAEERRKGRSGRFQEEALERARRRAARADAGVGA